MSKNSVPRPEGSPCMYIKSNVWLVYLSDLSAVKNCGVGRGWDQVLPFRSLHTTSAPGKRLCTLSQLPELEGQVENLRVIRRLVPKFEFPSFGCMTLMHVNLQVYHREAPDVSFQEVVN